MIDLFTSVSLHIVRIISLYNKYCDTKRTKNTCDASGSCFWETGFWGPRSCSKLFTHELRYK